MTCRWLLIRKVRALTDAGGLPQRYGPGDGRYPGYQIGPAMSGSGRERPGRFQRQPRALERLKEWKATCPLSSGQTRQAEVRHAAGRGLGRLSMPSPVCRSAACHLPAVSRRSDSPAKPGRARSSGGRWYRSCIAHCGAGETELACARQHPRRATWHMVQIADDPQQPLAGVILHAPRGANTSGKTSFFRCLRRS